MKAKILMFNDEHFPFISIKFVTVGWPTLKAIYALVADVGPSVVRPVVISRKLRKIDP